MLSRLLFFISCFLIASSASAISISEGDIFEVNWHVDLVEVDRDADKDDDYHFDDDMDSLIISATSLWTIEQYTHNSLVISIALTNTTILSPGLLDTAAITSFGFGVEPDPDSISLTTPGETFDSISSGQGKHQSFPGGYKEIDVCLFSGSKCSGGKKKHGLQAGESDYLEVSLLGDFGDSTDLLLFPARFKTSVGSYEPEGEAEITRISSPHSAVPEPSIMALIGLSLVAVLGFNRRFL